MVDVGGNANFRVRVGCARLFRYQHVDIPNAKLSLWGSKPTRQPNTSFFALQWNIGFHKILFFRRTRISRYIENKQVFSTKKLKK